MPTRLVELELLSNLCCNMVLRLIISDPYRGIGTDSSNLHQILCDPYVVFHMFYLSCPPSFMSIGCVDVVILIDLCYKVALSRSLRGICTNTYWGTDADPTNFSKYRAIPRVDPIRSAILVSKVSLLSAYGCWVMERSTLNCAVELNMIRSLFFSP